MNQRDSLLPKDPLHHLNRSPSDIELHIQLGNPAHGSSAGQDRLHSLGRASGPPKSIQKFGHAAACIYLVPLMRTAPRMLGQQYVVQPPDTRGFVHDGDAGTEPEQRLQHLAFHAGNLKTPGRNIFFRQRFHCRPPDNAEIKREPRPASNQERERALTRNSSIF